VAAEILKALARGGGSLPLRDLAAATGMPRAKVHRYLSSLRSTGLVMQEGDSGRYQIGPAAVTIGLIGLGRLSPIRQVQVALPALRDRINETVTAAVWGDRGPTIVAMEESDHVVTMNIRIGSVLPVLGTAIGQTFLAYLPETATAPFVRAELRAAGRTPGKDEIAGIIERIRARGLSRAESALLPGIDAVAAPVFNDRGKLVAVICAVGRAGVMSLRWNGSAAEALKSAAHDLSRQLGFAGS
jgi:DNA-binding IclR family transcriptional regulator